MEEVQFCNSRGFFDPFVEWLIVTQWRKRDSFPAYHSNQRAKSADLGLSKRGGEGHSSSLAKLRFIRFLAEKKGQMRANS